MTSDLSTEPIHAVPASGGAIASSERDPPVAGGEVLHRLHLSAVSLARVRYEPGVELPRHAHPQATILLVTSGGLVESVGGADYELGPGSVLLKPAGASHGDWFGSTGAECLVMALSGEPDPGGVSWAGSIHTVSHFTDGPVTHLALRVHRELEGGDSLTPLMVEGLVRELVAIAIREEDHGVVSAPPWLRRVRDRLHAEFTTGVTVEALADEADVHPSYLSRAFKRHYGIGISEYVRRLQVDRAAKALRTTDRPISQIAQDAGFFDQPHLTRVFKRYHGLTPGRFRARVERG